jgi:transglutaminase-like putative cysteine protease
MKFQITYSTAYSYSEPVRDNLNVLRVKPATTPHQSVDDFGFRVDPEARLHQYRDYFGSEVIEFGVTEAHERLALEAKMRVATAEQEPPPEGAWVEIESAGYRAAAGEFLLHTEAPPANGDFAALVEAARRATPLETTLALADEIPGRFEYEQGATFVGSTVADLLGGGAGVCQDFVHLGAMVLRELGVGARYVSGYLFAVPEDGGADSVEVQTHAWLEALIPDGEGERRWVGVDPTNRGRAGETHVKIGHGRDYQDVPPIRGVYRGPATADLSAAVEMRRLNGDSA